MLNEAEVGNGSSSLPIRLESDPIEYGGTPPAHRPITQIMVHWYPGVPEKDVSSRIAVNGYEMQLGFDFRCIYMCYLYVTKDVKWKVQKPFIVMLATKFGRQRLSSGDISSILTV